MAVFQETSRKGGSDAELSEYLPSKSLCDKAYNKDEGRVQAIVLLQKARAFSFWLTKFADKLLSREELGALCPLIIR